MKMRNTVDLPNDLLAEILSRVPEASLARFRSTSKGFNDMIEKDERIIAKKSKIIMLNYSRVYLTSIDLRETHQDNIVSVTSQLSLKDPLLSYTKEVDIFQIYHCDGLLLCTTRDERLVVWNLCSGNTKWIKPRNSYKGRDIYALGKSSCNKYKILRMVQSKFTDMPCLLEYEIYDFTSNSWRDLDKTTIGWFILGVWRCGTYVNGSTYWIALNCNNQNQPGMGNFILGFDFSTEKLTSVSLPIENTLINFFALSVSREDQKLCMLATSDKGLFDIDVWIMANKIDESNGAASWKKILTVERESNKQYFLFVNGISFLVERKSKVLVCQGAEYGNVDKFLHIVGEDKYIQVRPVSKCSQLVSYVPTLVKI
ncbi:unnamed protein product [Cochlearia groenlandica]